MRARRRRSVFNTVAAAVLEVAIMGIFVIIAQPQLREALFEILNVDQTAPVAQSTANARSAASPTQSAAVDRATLDRTVQAVLSSPVGQAIENSFSQWANGARTEINAPSLLTPQRSAPSLFPSTAAPTVSSGLRDQAVPSQVAGYSPYDQYESFRFSVPTNNQTAYQQPAANAFNGAVHQQYAVPQYMPSTGYNSHNYAPTQLNANQWNIASATQSPRPNGHANTNNWIPSQVTETSFRQVYPPPYGTQSMWK